MDDFINKDLMSNEFKKRMEITMLRAIKVTNQKNFLIGIALMVGIFFIGCSIVLRSSMSLFCEFLQRSIWVCLFEFQNCFVERNKRFLSLKLLKTQSC